MLTIVYLMRALNVLKYSKETEELLQKLIEADPMRKGYYAELSKWLIVDDVIKCLLLSVTWSKTIITFFYVKLSFQYFVFRKQVYHWKRTSKVFYDKGDNYSMQELKDWCN